MYKKILVPLDGSKRAETILRHVEEMALRFKAKIILLQVEEPALMLEHDEVVDLSLLHQELERRRQQAQTYLAGLQGEFREKGIEASSQVVRGSVVEAIVNAAQRTDVDLIAIASHGRGGLGRLFYGSVAAGILQRVDRPLLIIRTRQET